MENENFCNGYCWECEKFAEEDSELTKKQQEKEERRKEHEDAGKLDELIKELKEKEGKGRTPKKKTAKIKSPDFQPGLFLFLSFLFPTFISSFYHFPYLPDFPVIKDVAVI
jgi:Zn-dependent M16 (insulinase) family peptidase